MSLFPERVKLRKEDHTYWHDDGRRFESLSRVRAITKPDTDFKMIASVTAKKRGVDASVVQGEWDKKKGSACDIGNIIHDANETYGKTTVILPENEWLRPSILSIAELEKDYYQVYRELCIYDEENEIAMTADRVLETTRHKASIIDIDDYKTNESRGITYTCKYKNYLKHPFEHIQNSNYFDYSLQLSVEALTLQKLTGRKIGKLTITFIPPTSPLSWRIIPVSYMKYEAIALIDYWKELKHIKKEEGELEGEIIMPNFG
jgi:hypothetical protein